MAVEDVAYFLRLFERVLDPEFLRPLQASGDGYEVYIAAANVGARVADAVEVLERGAIVRSATGGRRASTIVRFTRPATGPLPLVTVLRGTVVEAYGQRRFITLDDAILTATTTASAAVRALALYEGTEYNVPGPGTAANGEAIPAEISNIVLLLEDPPLSDLSVRVEQLQPAIDGRPAMLDMLGRDRGIPREDAEVDDQYAYRIRRLPNLVTVPAIRETVRALLDAYRATYQFIETHEARYQTCWDEDADQNTFVYDDDAPPATFSNRWLDGVEDPRGFIVTIEALEPLEDYGGLYDDTADVVADLASPSTGGRRCFTQYDAESLDPGELDGSYLACAWDLEDLQQLGLQAGVYSAINKARAAGVPAILELQGQ
jgi:hypothetical protein